MTSDVSLNTVASQIQKTASSAQSLAGDYNQFLKLLTTQLQNQDPLNPMDSTQFTQQLVAFSGVEQQINMNQKLDSLNTLQLSNVASTALGYVGLDINYVSSEMNFDGSTPVSINYALTSAATTSTINILNADGNIVYSTDGAKTTDKQSFTWNGLTNEGLPAPAGTYSVSVNAVDANGKSVSSTTTVSGRVRGVETQNGVINLLVGNRAVPVSNVLNAVMPATANTNTATT